MTESTPQSAFPLDRGTGLKVVAGFVVALAVLALFAVGIGVGAIRTVLARGDPRWVAAACLSTLIGLAAWGKAWQVVLRVAGVEESYTRLVVTYFAATFANYVTPLGQAGGEPFIAYVLSRDTEASYQDSLASVVSADLLNLFPFFTFAAVGFAALLWRAAIPTGVAPLAVGLVVMGVVVPLVVAVCWRLRDPLERAALRLAAPVSRRTTRFSLAGLRGRIRELREGFRRIATDRRALAVALGYAYVGWVFFALPLYFAGLAVDVRVNLFVVLFIVPASTLAGLIPSPGGLGGVEAALVALLVGLVGLGSPTAYAIAIVYRFASYWFALVVGGAGAIYVIKRT